MAAQRLHVLDILVQGVARRVATAGAALAAMVEIDQLHVPGQRAHARLEAAVVRAGAAMDQEAGRPLAHRAAVRHQPGAVDVEIDLGVADTGAHAVVLGSKR